jgi:hypothetical protein
MTYEEAIASQPQARRKFGRLMYSWRLYNNWTQYTVHNWAKEAGFEAISYGNLSVIESGKAGELRQKTFFMLEELNRRLFERDYGNIKTLDLRKKVEGSKPLVHFGNDPWDAVDFWIRYIGRVFPIDYYPDWDAQVPYPLKAHDQTTAQ